MFGIGEGELAIIVVFGFLLFGPDKLPQMGRTIGRAIRQFRETQEKMTAVVQSEIIDPVSEAASAPVKPKKAAVEDDSDADEDTVETAAPAKKETFAERDPLAAEEPTVLESSADDPEFPAMQEFEVDEGGPKANTRKHPGLIWAIIAIVAVIALVILILYLVGAKLTDEIMGLIGALPDIWDSAENDFADIGQNLSVIYNRFPADVQQSIMDVINQIGSYVGDFLGKIGTPTINAVGNFAKQVPSILIGLIMALLSSYFFVAERDQLAVWFRKHTPAEVLSWYYMLKRGLVKAVGGYLKAQLKIEVWMYLLLVIGFAVLQVDYALLIALGIAFLDFLPFFGTGTVMVPWAIIKILSSDYKMAIGLLIIWGIGQLARQLIQPKIVGDSVGMPPLPTLFLLYIGYKLGGVVGMIVAVPIGLIALTMYQEGALQTTKDSVKILTAGINHFRRLKPEDMDEVRQMQERDQRLSEELARQAAEEEAQKEAQKEARKEAFAKKQKEKKS